MASRGHLRSRQRLGKYRIERRIGDGGFASVYRALDTIQGIRVALKVPHAELVTEQVMDDFRREIRTTSRLDHQNILPLQDASIIDERLVMVFRLGKETLDERLCRRMSLATALDIGEQLLRAVAYAHEQKIVHCDIKPENIILFDDGSARLSDFGIAKVSMNTLQGSGTGTVGYMAPEQAMGKPSTRADVFSVGLIMYRMLTGSWPEYPFEWPGPGYHRLRGRIHPDFIAFLKRSIAVKPTRRFRDASVMLDRFLTLKQKTLRHARARRKSAA